MQRSDQGAEIDYEIATFVAARIAAGRNRAFREWRFFSQEFPSDSTSREESRLE